MYHYYQLSNGIRIVHKQTSSPVSHCGLFIDVGSRDESLKENGMAHFIEHCIFKGTKKRKSFHILNRIDGIGGDLNAYTTKEETCIYASFLSNSYERTLELFSDILFHSTFPEKEINKEKDVIIDEIHSYEDSPSELIFDEFEEMVFANHPLGKKILGEPKLLKSFNSNTIINFIAKNYCASSMVISSVGNIDFKKMALLCKKYFENDSLCKNKSERVPFEGYTPVKKEVKRKTYQAHCLIGNLAYSFNDSKRLPLILLNNLLGGPAMNSRLNMSIREKYGYTYNLESAYTPYSDTGLFCIYAGMDFSYKEKTIDLILQELKILRENRLSDTQLKKAKIQLIGQIAINNESTLNEMLGIGKSYLVYDKVESFKEITQEILSVSAEEILQISNEICIPDQLSMLVYS